MSPNPNSRTRETAIGQFTGAITLQADGTPGTVTGTLVQLGEVPARSTMVLVLVPTGVAGGSLDFSIPGNPYLGVP